MTADASVLAFVLAGGEGRRLHPLTVEQPKPAVEFAGCRRIVDFVLSNLVLSRITPIYVLAQYKPRSLIEHIDDAWAGWSRSEKPLISVVLPDDNGKSGPFEGTADAVRKNLDLVRAHRSDIVAVFAADHIYRMDVRQMVRFHQRREADVTVAAVPVPIDAASSFGVLRTAPTGELLDFQEKPHRAVSMPGDPTRAFASMGNYLFKPRALIGLLEDPGCREGRDFGLDVLPRLAGCCRAFAYDFSTNRVPGIKPYEERTYWRDVGTREAYEAAQRDVGGPRPRFDLDNPEWPIGGSGQRLPLPAEPEIRGRAGILLLGHRANRQAGRIAAPK